MDLIEQFLNLYKTKNPRELFLSEIRIISKDYDISINGININQASRMDDLLILETRNNRKSRLKITPETKILINGESI